MPRRSRLKVEKLKWSTNESSSAVTASMYGKSPLEPEGPLRVHNARAKIFIALRRTAVGVAVGQVDPEQNLEGECIVDEAGEVVACQ